MRVRKALKNILLFELLYKIFIICLANPLMTEIYQTYVASKGLNFNQNIISVFINVKGMLIFVALFFCAAILIFYEFSVVVNIAALCKTGQQFTMGHVLKASVWNLSVLLGKNMIPSSIWYVLVLPFAHVGWMNSVVTNVYIPYFIIGEMVRSNIGKLGAIAIYAVQLFSALVLLFLPAYMILEQKTIGKALVSNFRRWKQITWKARGMIFLSYFAFYQMQTEMAKYWRRNVLEYKDFNLDFYRYLVHSEAFRIDVMYWIIHTAIVTVCFTLFAYMVVSLIPDTEKGQIFHPKWENDLGMILRIIGTHMGSGWRKVKQKLKQKRWKAVAALLILCIGFYIYISAGILPYIHEPWAIGHRGCKDGIENSMEAIEAADTYGVDYTEIDVQLSKDGIPVIVHDDNLWRLAKKAVNVTDLTLEELKELEITDMDHPGQTSRIPTLEEAIRFAKDAPNQMGLLIELKPNAVNGFELADAVMKLVEQYEFGEKAIFMSLEYACLYPITKAHPEWWVGYCIFGSPGKIDDSVWQYDIDFIASEENQISNQLVIEARAHSLPVYVWTVFDPEKMRQYLEMGVTGIISDFPQYAVEEIKKYNEKHDDIPYNWRGDGYPKEEENAY